MESGILAIVLLGVVILILIPFIYFGVKAFGYPRLAWVIGLVLGLIVLIPMIKYGYRSQMYDQEEAKKDLQSAGIVPKNGLKIIHNEISGYKHLQQQAIFILDTVDINKAIKRIESNPNYIISPKRLNLKEEIKQRNFGTIQRVYRYKNNFIVEQLIQTDEYTIKATETILKKNIDTVYYKKLEEF